MITDTSEKFVGGDLGIKIRLDETASADSPKSYKDAGENVAANNSTRAKSVWVWTYAHDMDMEGPALCVSYVEGSDKAITEFFDPTALYTYYTLKREHMMMLKAHEVPEGKGD